MSEIKVSAIIPIYNVEEYLAECLDSMIQQNKGKIKDAFEVIMIDDGSTDSSGDIAKEYADNNDYFHYYRIENDGLGHARNAAVEYAKGKYIAFADSDDIVVAGTYEKMYILAEKNNSDLTICNVLRFNTKKEWESGIHKRAFRNIAAVTHITNQLALIYDAASWNKLINREFYLRNDFQFPEHILYEDIPVMLPMHYLANNVSVLRDYGYLWRVRDGATRSISQNNSDIENFTDRLKVIEKLDDFFSKNVKEKDLLEAKNCRFLDADLILFVNICKKVEREKAYEIMEIVRSCLSNVKNETYSKLSVIDRQKYAYVLQNDLDGLIETLNFEHDYYNNIEINQQTKELELPKELFKDIDDFCAINEISKYDPRRYINKIITSQEKIEIYAHI
ncbi:MAG: glycosyltransferase [Clostridiales bacterium]|nr:glycosyltransferase [Clostridiales bacterium]